MLQLFIVRHGESLRNMACLMAHQGYDDLLGEQLRHPSNESMWPLTDKGRVQSMLAGKWIARNADGIDAIYSSPYLRAWETAQRLRLGVKIEFDGRLKEREWGEYAPGHYSVKEYVRDLAECSEMGWKSRFPGAESLYDLIPASRDLVDELQAKRRDGTVVLVTHGGRMQALEHLIEESQSPRKYPNCSVLQYRFEPDALFRRVDYPAQPELEPVS